MSGYGLLPLKGNRTALTPDELRDGLVYRGGNHAVTCPGDGWHYTVNVDPPDRTPCAAWRGGCPVRRLREAERVAATMIPQ